VKKALLNYWVDVVTGCALLVCAVTGIVRLFPEATSVASGTATIFGVSSALWATVHDWSGVVMAAGVALHTLLHARWLMHMTRKIARGEASGRSRSRTVPFGRAGRTPGAAPPSTSDVVTAGSPDAAAATSLSRLEAMGARDEEPRRMNRKAFLLGAAAVGGAAVLAGVGLASAGGGTAVASSTTTQTTATSGTSSSSSSSSATTSDTAAAASSDSSATSDTSSGASETVVVDSSACVGCGHCVESCPNGVFTFSGGKAVVSNAGDCTLCGRCVQVCRPQAITLNG
jgi:NAD-dependent dihydropyrimidine dehydrogenase PreA subunit